MLKLQVSVLSILLIHVRLINSLEKPSGIVNSNKKGSRTSEQLLNSGINVYFIYYGRTWHDSRTYSMVQTFVQSLNPSSRPSIRPNLHMWWSIVSEYSDKFGSPVIKDVSFVGYRWYHHKKLLTPSINSTADAAKIINLSFENETMDPNGFYIILSRKDIKVQFSCEYCSVHNVYKAKSGFNVRYAWIHDCSTACPRCNPFSNRIKPPNGDLVTDSTIFLLSWALPAATVNPFGFSAYIGNGFDLANVCSEDLQNGPLFINQKTKGMYNMYGIKGSTFLVSPLLQLSEGECLLQPASTFSPLSKNVMSSFQQVEIKFPIVMAEPSIEDALVTFSSKISLGQPAPAPSSSPPSPTPPSPSPPPPSLLRIPPLRASPPLSPPSPSQKSNSGGIIIGASLGLVVFITIIVSAIVIYCCFCVKTDKYSGTGLVAPKIPGEIVEVGGGHYTRRFTLGEVMAATNNFSEAQLLGRGGFGSVYSAQFKDGEVCAVKKGHTRLFDDQIPEFVNEVKFISRINHHNLVSLMGFCDERGEQILVYQYVGNGNVRQHIHGDERYGSRILNVEQRIKIAMDSAKGLDYLHNFGNAPVVHRDVKSENILLDENFNAKVSDFGFVKALDATMTHATADVVGTYGYMDPEYISSRKVSPKCDVYSFGIVLLELVTGKKPTFLPSNEQHMENRIYESLVVWVRKELQEGSVSSIVDPALGSAYHLETVSKVINLAMSCTKYDGKLRPSMRQIISQLEQIEYENDILCGRVVSVDSREKSLIEETFMFPVDPSNQASSSIDDSAFFLAPISMRPQPK